MDFKKYPNLANLSGVFKGVYKMHGPYKTPDDAKRDAERMGAKTAIYIESNYSLYIPKVEVPDATYSAFKEVKPEPKPEPKPQVPVENAEEVPPTPGRWLKHG
jgi:hypothetical protein